MFFKNLKLVCSIFTFYHSQIQDNFNLNSKIYFKSNFYNKSLKKNSNTNFQIQILIR